MRENKHRRRKVFATNLGIGIAIVTAFLVTGLAIIIPSDTSRVAISQAEPARKDWAGVAGAAMATAGFTFGAPAFADGILTIRGDAPDAQSRIRAFDIGVRKVLADKTHVGQVLAFDNAITIAGERVISVPDAASALGDAPPAQACQTAYNTLLKGRVINFGSASAVLAEESKPLLDALAAVAIRCGTYKVELGGHTDTKGDATANQALSERRAQSVADYLVSKSVPASQLGVNGFGESQPLNSTNSVDADAVNRRIEFDVVEGQK